MRLFAYFRSSTSYRLRIALELKGLSYEVIPVDLRTSEQSGEAFTSRNPFGTVPMLEADGRDRAQSMAMLEWLEEAYPTPALLPEDTEDRYTVRELAYAIATEIHALNNLQVLKYLRDPLGHDDGAVNTWYHHWLARTLDPVEARLAQIGSGEGGAFGDMFQKRKGQIAVQRDQPVIGCIVGPERAVNQRVQNLVARRFQRMRTTRSLQSGASERP